MPSNHDDARTSIPPDQYHTLLGVAEAIVSHRDLLALIHDLGGLLRQVVDFEHLVLGLHDPVTHTMRPYVLQSSAPMAPHSMPSSMAVASCPMGWVWLSQKPLLFPDDQEAARTPQYQHLAAMGMRRVCILPL